MTPHQQLLIDQVKKRIQHVVQQVICNGSKQDALNIKHAVSATLQHLQTQRAIHAYQVEVDQPPPEGAIRNVDCLPITATPGDPLIDNDGKYRGIIVSTDGEGNGVVMGEPRPNDSLVCRCKVQPLAALEYVMLEVRVE